jgi:hypothetical protein
MDLFQSHKEGVILQPKGILVAEYRELRRRVGPQPGAGQTEH